MFINMLNQMRYIIAYYDSGHIICEWTENEAENCTALVCHYVIMPKQTILTYH